MRKELALSGLMTAGDEASESEVVCDSRDRNVLLFLERQASFLQHRWLTLPILLVPEIRDLRGRWWLKSSPHLLGSETKTKGLGFKDRVRKEKSALVCYCMVGVEGRLTMFTI